MPIAKLSAAYAATAQCEPGQKKTDHTDDGTNCTGLLIETRPSGGKTWYLKMHINGRIRQIKIGRYGEVSFAQARKKAQQLRSEIVLGDDPAAKKAQARAVPLYAELAAQHLADAKLHQRSFSTTEAYMNNHVLKRWSKVRLTDIEGRAVAQWLAAKRDAGLAPATVLKIKAIFSRSFELGARWQVPGCERNPVRGVKLPPVNNARQRFLSAEEAARLIEAAKASKNRQLAPIVSLLLLCGTRVSELLSARWENVDLERRMLFVPTSKTGRSRHIPLARAALDLISVLPRPKGAVFLFPNPADPSKHLTTIKHGFQTARSAAGLGDVRVHDLRHSAASFMVNSGVDLFAVGRVLGHANVASTSRYAHLNNTTLLAAVEAGAAKQTLPTT